MVLNKTYCVVCNVQKRPLFSFPKDPDRLNTWLKRIRKEEMLLQYSAAYIRTNGRLCSEHFHETCFTSTVKNRLHKFSLPIDLQNECVTNGMSLSPVPVLDEYNDCSINNQSSIVKTPEAINNQQGGPMELSSCVTVIKTEDEDIVCSASNDTDSFSMDSSNDRETLSFCGGTSNTSVDNCVQIKSEPISSSESGDESGESISNQISEKEWLDPIGNQPHITPFRGRPGWKMSQCECSKIEQCYSLLVTDDLFQEISNQTNLHALQVLSQNESGCLDEWIPTFKDEIKSLFGLVLWMGIVKLPEINLYWSKDPVFAQTFPRSVMSQNRFELLLRMLNFTNNENVNEPLNEIKLIIDELNENFKKYYDPPENVCIEESLIPFEYHGSFSKYTKQMKRWDGFKMTKLCSQQGYTHRFKIYTGESSGSEKQTPTNAVISLSKHILGKGHTIYTDSWYTNMDLAQKLVDRNTHLVGTVHPNCSGLNKEVIAKQLKPGESFAKELKNGITLMKWKGKRDVLALSTKHSTEMLFIRKNGYDFMKPTLISDYNHFKSSVDVSESDEMTTYSKPLRKAIQGYKKLAFELLLNMAVINAWIMCNCANQTPISILEGRKNLVSYLCNKKEDESPPNHK